MTTHAQEHTTSGTPSGNRDASRVQVASTGQALPHSNELKYDDDDEKSLNFEHVDEKSLDPSLSTESALYEELRSKPTLNRNESLPFKRPALGSRHNTNVSIAAAPYGGNFWQCDLKKYDTVSLDHKDIHSLSRAPTGRARSSSSSSTAPTLTNVPSNLAAASRVSTDAYGNTYPEGGLEAWLCVFGSFCGLMSALGLMNTIATYQAYLSTHQLRNHSEGEIGWIFGIYAFLSFFCGIQIGPFFDAKGPRYLVLAGSILMMATYLLLGICQKYWHFLIVFGVLGGTGTSLVFTPAIASVGHFFLRKRGQCTGLAAVGGSLGGIVYPLTLQALLPRIGFAWSTRVLALINLVLLIIANLCIKSRLPARKATKESILPDLRIFRDPIFALTTLGVFFIEWGLFVPLSYLTSYALAHGIDSTFSYQLIAILNVGSCAGRYFPGLIADKFGRFNAMVITVFLCLVSTLALWLPAGGHTAIIVIYALVFGFASGSGISLTPVCVGQLCKVENYGRYYATCYTLVSFGSLTGIPIAGQLVSACGGEYWGLIVFTGCAYTASTITFTAARVLGAGWSLKDKY